MALPTKPPGRLERIEWVAEYANISLPTAYRLAQAGRLPGAVKIGASWRIDTKAFLAALHVVPA